MIKRPLFGPVKGRAAQPAARHHILRQPERRIALQVRCAEFKLPDSGDGIADVIEVRRVTEADINGDGVVDGADLASMLSQWGGPGSGDLNGDGTVDGADLANLLANFGPCM